MSRDPIGDEGGLNLYGFVGNDAIAEMDLFGLSSGRHSEYDFEGKDTEYADTWIGIPGTQWTKMHGVTYSPVYTAESWCTCGSGGKWYPRFAFKVSTQSFILNKDHPEWLGDHHFTDHDVQVSFQSSNWRWYRRLFVRLHERNHRKHARSNYDAAVSTLRYFEDYGWFSRPVCEETADDLVDGEKRRFYYRQVVDGIAVDHNPR